MVTTPELGDVLGPGDHGSTFAGAPVQAGAALAVLEIVHDPELLRRVAALGERLMEGLARLDAVVDVRGRGLMVGATLAPSFDASEVAVRALEAGLVLNVPGERMLRFLPPLVIWAEDVDEALARLRAAIG